MFIDIGILELMDLLDNGSTNQKNFSKKLTIEEFLVFSEVWEEYVNEEIICNPEIYEDILLRSDLRSLLNGGALEVLTLDEIKEHLEEEPEDLEPYEIMEEYANRHNKILITGFEDKAIFLE